MKLSVSEMARRLGISVYDARAFAVFLRSIGMAELHEINTGDGFYDGVYEISSSLPARLEAFLACNLIKWNMPELCDASRSRGPLENTDGSLEG